MLARKTSALVLSLCLPVLSAWRGGAPYMEERIQCRQQPDGTSCTMHDGQPGRCGDRLMSNERAELYTLYTCLSLPEYADYEPRRDEENAKRLWTRVGVMWLYGGIASLLVYGVQRIRGARAS